MPVIDKSDFQLGFWITIGVLAALFAYMLLSALYQKAKGR